MSNYHWLLTVTDGQTLYNRTNLPEATHEDS